MKDDPETQPSPDENSEHTDGGPPAPEGRPAAEGPATESGAQAGPPPGGSVPPPPGGHGPLPPEGQPPGGHRPAPRLTRRKHDKVIGGVAGGIADYFGIDPLLVRLAFAGFALLGGGGIVLYVLGWIFIPERGEGEPTRMAPLADVAKYLGIGLIVVATLIIIDGIGFGPRGFGPFEHLFFAIILFGLGAFLLRKEAVPTLRPGPPAPTPVETSATGAQTTTPMVATSQATPIQAPPAGTTYPATPPGYEPAGSKEKTRERSSLGLLTLAAVLLTTGAAALLNNLGVTSFDGGQLSALALTVLGGGLIVGAWWGRARWLIWIGILMFPIVAVSNLIDLSMVSRDGEVGQFSASPQDQADIDDGYQILAGEATIDLVDFEFTPGEPAELEIDIAFGQLTVIVPRDAYVELDGSMEAGKIQFFDTQRAGQGVTFVDDDGDLESDARVSLHVDGALGQVEVLRSPIRASLEGEGSDRGANPRPERRERRERERP